MDSIFREYDIRGVAGKELTDEFAFLLGKAFGAYLKTKNQTATAVSVGRDTRLSSESLSANLINGILSSGLDVYDIGLCPTPLQYFSIHHLGLDGGIMVTGSHNPPEYNGFKVSIGRETIFGEEIRKLKDIMQENKRTGSPEKGRLESYDILTAYKDAMISRFSYLSGKEYGKIKVVVDAGNGTGGVVAPQILEAMGCEVVPLFCEPDGMFPNHHPDPTVVEYIKDLIRVTLEEKADIGVGYDGDADRIGLIDSAGNIVWGDQMMIILSRDILRKNQGAVIIGDVKCSQVMFDDIKKHGGKPVMWKTGHSLVKDKMKKEGALLAGEFSGHIFFADDYFGFDDALYTTFRLIEIMKTTGLGIHELLSDIPVMHFTPEMRIECPDNKKKEAVEGLLSRFRDYKNSGAGPLPVKDIHDIDGLKVVFEKGWGLVRMSNTQPVVVMRFEAEDEQSLEQYRNFIEKEFKRIMEIE